MPKNTWAGLEIKSRTTLQRQPWSDQEISKLLATPIWQSGELPRDAKAGGIAAYWIPLLALHTGARCSELSQLRLDDIDISSAIPTINITDQGEGQQVKSQAGLRIVPIHSELMRLGFSDYITSLKGPLVWPALPQRKGKPGGYFSHYFSELRRSLDVPPSMVLHSFRHNVRTALSEANIPEAVIDKLLGHEAQGSIGARVYTHVPLKLLQSAIATLTFPTSSLKKLAWTRVATKTI
jgi:integrase